MTSRIAPLLLLAGGLLSATSATSATQPAARQSFQTLKAQAAAWLESQSQKSYPDSQIQVRMGPVDERLNLPACPEPAFFLPKGVKLWGNGSLGARCDGPAKWRLYLSFDNVLRGPALVAQRPVPARAMPGGDDLALRLLDYQQDPERYARELPPGASLAKPLAVGQALLVVNLIQPEVIRAGQKVRVIARGAGFDVAQEGTAQGSAAPGDKIKVKTPAGRIVQGVAARDGSVVVMP